MTHGRCHSPETATSATASSGRPTAASTGRTSPATSSRACRPRGSSWTRRTPTTSTPRSARPRRRRRTTPPIHSRYGVWESRRRGALEAAQGSEAELNGATDLQLDPRKPKILYSSFWGDAIYKSTDGGKKWKPVMNGLPDADLQGARPGSRSRSPTRAGGQRQPSTSGSTGSTATVTIRSRVFKSTDGAASWTMLPGGSGQEEVADYCGGQCFYDNVIEATRSTRTSCTRAASSTTPSARAGSSAPTTAARPGRTSAGPAPGLPRLRVRPSDPKHICYRLRRRRLVQPSTAAAGSAGEGSAQYGDNWQNPTARCRLRRSRDAPDRAPDRSVHVDRDRADRTGRYLGGTQDNGTLRQVAASVRWFDIAQR